MKLLIASDIHGSAECTRRLIERYCAEKADKMLLLGDILYHGPRNALPGEYDCPSTAAMLNELKNDIFCVRGNCDAEVDQMVLEFPSTSDYMCLPWQGRMIFATHGHRYGPHYLPPLEELDLLLCGHTHVPTCEKLPGGGIYCNPGSVSIPKGGSACGYMTLSDGLLCWKKLDGSVYMNYEMK